MKIQWIATILVGLFSLTVSAAEMGATTTPEKSVYGNELLTVPTQPTSAEAMGRCDMLYPGEKSIGQRYCREGYGVVYEGYFVNNTCYGNFEDARRTLRQTRACRDAEPRDNCRFSPPDRRDRAGRFCDNRWGVTYRGYINNNKCYTEIDTALETWYRTRACAERPRMGRCRVAFPGERDDVGEYCDGRFGILFRGRIIRNTCYLNVDDTMRRARDFRECRR